MIILVCKDFITEFYGVAPRQLNEYHYVFWIIFRVFRYVTMTQISLL